MSHENKQQDNKSQDNKSHENNTGLKNVDMTAVTKEYQDTIAKIAPVIGNKDADMMALYLATLTCHKTVTNVWREMGEYKGNKFTPEGFNEFLGMMDTMAEALVQSYMAGLKDAGK